MSTSDEEFQQEQQRVDYVVKKVTESLGTLGKETSKLKTDIVNIRKNFWDDVTVNMEDEIEAAETAVSIKQQAEVLSDKERIHHHTDQQIKLLSKLLYSPYFGRIDFKEIDEQESTPIYLGLGTYYDEEIKKFLVYDWRAPISSLYYDVLPGPAKYETPGGTVAGVMELKRQFLIRHGVIRSLFDSGITIGDELLKEVLGKQADSGLKNIVSTIQREQNQIIRDEKSHLIVVQGAAGSGKTSSAMQRMAYLLYRFRDTLQADQIVLFSPNTMFNSYVSTVLPELGEENMQQSTFQGFLDQKIGGNFEVEDSFTQLEYVLNPVDDINYEARLAGISFKASIDFMKCINTYLSSLLSQGFLFRDITVRDQIVVKRQEIIEQFYLLDESMSIANRLEYIQKWLIQEIKKHEKAERAKPWVDEEMDLLDEEVYTKVHRKLQKRKRYAENTFDDYKRERELLASVVLNRVFRPIYKLVEKLAFVNIAEMYKRLFEDSELIHTLMPELSLPAHWDVICKQTKEKLDQFILTYEDATPYLYFKESIEGFETNRRIKHIFIDEAQDYTLFQFSFIKHLYPRSKMTVLGDINQTIYAHPLTDGLSPLLRLFEPDKAKMYNFQRSYRPTKPIIEFTRQLIPNGNSIEPFERFGKIPTLMKVSHMDQLIDAILDRVQSIQKTGHKSIAIICKTAKESQEAFNLLKEKLVVSLLKAGTGTFKTGIVVIPSYLAKGIEFDAVIVYNASAQVYHRERERRLFYTVCTRAMHELHLFWLGTESHFIRDIDPRSYKSREV